MLEQFQEWLSSLPGTVIVQTMNTGQTLVAIQNGTVSTCAIRPTFVEAAEAAIRQVTKTATKKTR